MSVVTGKHTASISEVADPDRAFRPDVEGLRAIAVAVVVLSHALIPGFEGGYVGVDIFFVISGFVITKLLLRQTDGNTRPRFGEFYARRARRILPAAMLVAAVTVVATYHYLGFIRGNMVSRDARWIAVFLGNNHFAAVGTDYFARDLPPSPLQNYWSLAVEEQFYVVYPAALALLALAMTRRVTMRTKILIFNAAVLVISLAWSIYYTDQNGPAAYFSVFTRAWELALGGVIAAGTVYWARIAPKLAAALAWAGVATMAVSVFTYNEETAYPGYHAALPVVGAAITILGGVAAGRLGPELVLGTAPMRWIGQLSFSIYLWHWPLITLAVENADTPLSVGTRSLLILASLAAAAITYYLIENPLRKASVLRRSRALSLGLGLVLITAVIVLASYEIASRGGLTFGR